MKRNFWLRQLPLAILGGGLVITAAAWQNHSADQKHETADTTPKNRVKKIRNIDEALEELDRGERELNRSMKELDFSKMEKEIAESMKKLEVDLSKMHVDIERSIKEIDVSKIRESVQNSLKDLPDMQKELAKFKDVDAAQMKAEMEQARKEIEKAMKEIDADKIKAEVEASIAKIDREKMKKEIEEEIKKIDVEKMKAELKNIRPEVERSMQEARVSIENAREELKAFKGFIDNLDKDGLINKNGQYTIRHDDGELTINGKKQSQEVYNKYRSFLEKHKEFKLTKDDDSFDMDID